jgi:hypothetical protein
MQLDLSLFVAWVSLNLSRHAWNEFAHAHHTCDISLPQILLYILPVIIPHPLCALLHLLSKEAVATDAGSSRCNRLLRRKSTTGVQKRSPRAPPLSDNGTADAAKANNVVKKGKACNPVSSHRGRRQKGGDIFSSNKAHQVVKENKEAFAVKEDKATPTIRGYITKIEVEIKKDGALIKDAKDQVLSSVVNGKDASIQEDIHKFKSCLQLQ